MTMTDDQAADYDEFGMLQTYADYEGIPWKGRPEVARRTFEVAPGQHLSAIQWGAGDPELVLLHGGGQNAHTWDSVAMALDRPLLAVDLPGHGHSHWRDDRNYTPQANAQAVASLVSQAAPDAEAVIGMSLGGLTNIHLASTQPELVRRAVIIDVLPATGLRAQSMTQEERGAVSLVGGQPTFDSFEEMLKATAAAVPGRPIESLRTGVLHNAKRLDDGRWAWRYDRLRQEGDGPIDFTALWEDVAAVRAPMMLVRGGKSVFVHDDDVARFRELQPAARVEIVDGAGHSVQSDRPLVLAGLIVDFLTSTA
jgi:pimeloyl-ACP methyl ester carboxylesterase